MEHSGAEHIGDIFKSVRQERKMTQFDFSRSLGIAQGYLSDIEHGKKFPSDTLIIALSQLYDVPRDTVSTFVNIPDVGVLRKEIPLLRTLDLHAPHGLIPGEVADYIRVPGMAAECYGITAAGNFMSPTICDGDIVIFQRGAELAFGDIGLISNIWGEAIFRRYRLKDGEVFFAADNNTYAPFRPEEETVVFGKVLAIWRKIPIIP